MDCHLACKICQGDQPKGFVLKEIEKVTLFYEISKALNEHLDLEKSLYTVLKILSEHMNMVRGTISILNPLANEINTNLH